VVQYCLYYIFNLESFQKLIFAQMLPRSFAHNKNLIKQKKKKRAERVMGFQSPAGIHNLQHPISATVFFSWINGILYANEELKGRDNAS